MGLKTFLTLATLGLVAAEQSVVSLFFIGGGEEEQPSLVGSVVSAESDTTTYSINCAKTVDTNDCPYLPGLLYTAGPTTVEYALKTPYDRYGTVVCSVGGTTSAECTDKGRLSGSSTLPAQTTKLGSIYITSHSVTITAGATATATGASATKTDDSASSGATNSDSTVSQTSSGASSTSSGGIPRITANPGIALGGAAAAFMMAAL